MIVMIHRLVSSRLIKRENSDGTMITRNILARAGHVINSLAAYWLNCGLVQDDCKISFLNFSNDSSLSQFSVNYMPATNQQQTDGFTHGKSNDLITTLGSHSARRAGGESSACMLMSVISPLFSFDIIIVDLFICATSIVYRLRLCVKTLLLFSALNYHHNRLSFYHPNIIEYRTSSAATTRVTD